MARGRTSRRKAGRNASVPVSVTSASSSNGDSGNGNNAEDGTAEDIVAVTATATATLAATESSPNSTARVVVSVQSSDVGKDDDGSAEASSTGEKRSKRSRAARGRRDASTARKTIDVTPAAKKTKKMSRSSSSRWEAKFELLKQYIEKFGDARVPSALHSEEFPRLGSVFVCCVVLTPFTCRRVFSNCDYVRHTFACTSIVIGRGLQRNERLTDTSKRVLGEKIPTAPTTSAQSRSRSWRASVR